MRMGALFKRGYEVAREEKKKQEERREQLGKRLFRFFLGDDGDEAKVRFLTEEPVNLYEHTIKTAKNGKEHYDSILCSGGDNCPYCAEGDKPSYKGAFLIFDYTPFEVKDDKGKKKTVNGSLKLYVAGTRVVSQLDRLSEKYGLTSRDYEISRSGKGTQTSYMFERTDDVFPLTKKKIEGMLPDKLKDRYDGTEESLFSIIEEQLEMYLPDSSHKNADEDDDDDEDNEEEYKSRKNLISCEDEEEDFDEDDEKPVRKTLKGGKSVKGLFRKKK